MADCAQMETASSHFIPELVGACISTAIVAVGMFFFNWRMALAALWVLPVSFLIVGCSGKVQKSLNQKQMELKMACADGIQECLESARDLHAYNAEDDYMRGLDVKIKAVEKHAVVTELGTAVFVGKCSDDLKARNCHGCTGWGNSAGKRGDQCAYILYVSAGCIQDL